MKLQKEWTRKNEEKKRSLPQNDATGPTGA